MSGRVRRCVICHKTKPIGEYRLRPNKGSNVHKSRCNPCDDQWRQELTEIRAEGKRPDEIRTSISRTI